MRDRIASTCEDFARRDHRVNVTRSSSVNVNGGVGRPVLGISAAYAHYEANLRRNTLVRVQVMRKKVRGSRRAGGPNWDRTVWPLVTLTALLAGAADLFDAVGRIMTHI
jgi:hypothetical protein